VTAAHANRLLIAHAPAKLHAHSQHGSGSPVCNSCVCLQMKDGVFQFAEMKEAVGTLMTPEMATRARKAIETCQEPGRRKKS